MLALYASPYLIEQVYVQRCSFINAFSVKNEMPSAAALCCDGDYKNVAYAVASVYTYSDLCMYRVNVRNKNLSNLIRLIWCETFRTISS